MIYPWFTQDTISWNSEMAGSRLVFSQACGEEEVEAVEMAEVHRGSIDGERYGKTWKRFVKLLNYNNNICMLYIYIYV